MQTRRRYQPVYYSSSYFRKNRSRGIEKKKPILIIVLFIALIITAISINGGKRVTGQGTVPTRITLVPKQSPKETGNSTLPISLGLSQKGKPTILIYHTHALESYTPTDKYPYDALKSNYRTADNKLNMVAVGDVLMKELEGYGFNVLHDTTNHEPPKLSTAYERSLVTMESYKNRYPSLVLYIDLHRDASGTANKNDYCIVDGKKSAKIMFVVGMGKNAQEKPDFDSNYGLAESLTEYLRDINGELARDIRVKAGRYNQHISNHCLLAEIGHNMNTLEEAMEAAKLFAKAIADISVKSS